MHGMGTTDHEKADPLQIPDWLIFAKNRVFTHIVTPVGNKLTFKKVLNMCYCLLYCQRLNSSHLVEVKPLILSIVLPKSDVKVRITCFLYLRKITCS